MEYSGVCAQYLERDTSLFTLTLDEASKKDINNLINALKNYRDSGIINGECYKAVFPFLCQYIFPPCDNSSGNVNFINKKQCFNIRDVVCKNEWMLFMNVYTALAYLLPNCEIFGDYGNNMSSTAAVPQSLECHYQFKEFCGLCLPLCGKFSQYRVETKFQERSILIFSGITAFIGGILVFIASACRWKAM